MIDIGGQDAKVIRLDANGQRLSHRMNRKCAAGTGSFLDEIALRLGVPIETMDELAADFTEELELSSFCTVFAGTELLTLIRSGKRPADLAMAAYRSLVKRIVALDVLQGKAKARHLTDFENWVTAHKIPVGDGRGQVQAAQLVPRAIALAKRLVDQSFERNAAESADAETAAQVELLHSPEFLGRVRDMKDTGEI